MQGEYSNKSEIIETFLPKKKSYRQSGGGVESARACASSSNPQGDVEFVKLEYNEFDSNIKWSSSQNRTDIYIYFYA